MLSVFSGLHALDLAYEYGVLLDVAGRKLLQSYILSVDHNTLWNCGHCAFTYHSTDRTFHGLLPTVCPSPAGAPYIHIACIDHA